MLILVCTWTWSWWAGAQTNTNSVQNASVATNRAPAFVSSFERLDQHYLTFGLDRIAPLRDHSFLGEPLWKYLASVIYILLAFYVAKLLDLVAFVWLKKLAAKTVTRLDDFLLELLHGPLKIVAFVVFLEIGLNLFDWSERAKSYLGKIFVLVVAASLTYLTLKVVEALLNFWQERHAQEANRKFNDQLFSVIRKSLYIFIVVVAVLVTASNIGVNITAAITSLSIGGLAVGLAAQDTLANLFGAVSVFADKPFRVGDQIKLDAAEGIVESVGMRSTRVRNPEGYMVAVPNKTIANAAITNLSHRPSIKTTLTFALAKTLPSEKLNRALAILDEVYRKNPMTQDAWISFNQFAAGSLNIMVVHWWKGSDYSKYLAAIQEMNLAVKQKFDADGIAFA